MVAHTLGKLLEMFFLHLLTIRRWAIIDPDHLQAFAPACSYGNRWQIRFRNYMNSIASKLAGDIMVMVLKLMLTSVLTCITVSSVRMVSLDSLKHLSCIVWTIQLSSGMYEFPSVLVVDKSDNGSILMQALWCCHRNWCHVDSFCAFCSSSFPCRELTLVGFGNYFKMC
jgi:hypothetical protein